MLRSATVSIDGETFPIDMTKRIKITITRKRSTIDDFEIVKPEAKRRKITDWFIVNESRPKSEKESSNTYMTRSKTKVSSTKTNCCEAQKIETTRPTNMPKIEKRIESTHREMPLSTDNGEFRVKKLSIKVKRAPMILENYIKNGSDENGISTVRDKTPAKSVVQSNTDNESNQSETNTTCHTPLTRAIPESNQGNVPVVSTNIETTIRSKTQSTSSTEPNQCGSGIRTRLQSRLNHDNRSGVQMIEKNVVRIS